MKLNWDKFEKQVVGNFQIINKGLDELVLLEKYEEAKIFVDKRDEIYKMVANKIITFGAYTTTINNAYKILGYENPNTKYLK